MSAKPNLAAILERSQRDCENWKYTDLAKLLKRRVMGSAVKTALPPLLDNAVRFIFVDGVWQTEPSRLGALPPTFLQGNAVQGYRLILDGQTCLVTQPVELLFLSSGAKTETSLQFHIQLGISGRLTLIERHMAAGTAMIDTQIMLKSHAKLLHGKIVSDGDARHLATTTIDVADGAYYDNFTLISGGPVTRNEIHLHLLGKLAQGRLNGAMLLAGDSHADTTTHITHAAAHGTSRQIYKTVLADKAHGVFQGKIIVAEGAQKTDGHQLSRALLLSDQAEMNAKPQLEIYADDVKCSHGSTIGELDGEALFYLRSRGLSEAEARMLLLEAFVGEIVDDIPIGEGRDLVRAEIRGWLNERSR